MNNSHIVVYLYFLCDIFIFFRERQYAKSLMHGWVENSL